MADGAARRDDLGRRDDALRVDPKVAVEVGDGASLAKLLDAERAGAVAHHRAEPGQSRRVAVEHGDEAAVGRYLRQQTLDMALGVDDAALPRPLGRDPAGIEAVSRGDRQKTDVAPVLGYEADR